MSRPTETEPDLPARPMPPGEVCATTAFLPGQSAGRVNLVTREDRGFSLLELLVVIIILAIVAAFAIPSALNSLRAYKLHSDAAALASQMNVARFRATSQYTPYRLTIDVADRTYTVERLNTSYGSPTAELGPVNVYGGNTFTTTNPGGSIYPGTLTGGTGVTNFYFNTRGMPVDSSGSPVANGGTVIYLTNSAGLTDAIVALVGGRIGVYNWDGTVWKAR